MSKHFVKNGNKMGGTWVAQLVKLLTLHFSSGPDLRVVRLSPVSGCLLGVEAALDSLASLHPAHTCFLSQKTKKPPPPK